MTEQIGDSKSVVSGDLSFIRIATPQLRFMVENQRKLLPEVQYLELIEDIRKLFDKFSRVLAEYHPGAGRAAAAHSLINEAIKQTANINATCFKGCGSCCHLEVEVTRDEGELLAQVVNSGGGAGGGVGGGAGGDVSGGGGMEFSHKRLAIQAARERKSSDWQPMIQENNRCVFLGADQACQIYESRPLACRKVLMESNPIECSKIDGSPRAILIPLAEIVLSAALSQPGNTYTSLSKSLSEGLRQAKQLAGDKDEVGVVESGQIVTPR